MKSRSITLISALALSMWAVTASGAEPRVVPFHFTHGGFVSNVTPDGLWAVGVPRAGDSNYLTQIVDLTTGKLITLNVNTVYDQDGDADDDYLMEGVEYYTSAVSADGKIIGGSVDGNPAIWQNDEWRFVDFPNQARKDPFLNYYAEISAIKGDGKYMTGMAYNEAFDIVPLFWDNGVLKTLYWTKEGELVSDFPGIPTTDWVGNEMGYNTGSMRFFNVTNDGRYIIGGMNTNVAHDGCCFFVYDREKGESNFIGVKELNEKIKAKEIGIESEIDGTVPPFLSDNGKYLAGNVLLVYEPDTEFGRDAHIPFLYNLETKEFKMYEGEQHEDIIICGVTNDGRLVGSDPYSSVNRAVVFLGDNDQWYSLENILEQVYQINFIQAAGYDGLSGTAFGISTDGKVLTAMAPGAQNDGYSVVLEDESFFDATKRVNLLYNSQVSPLALSSIATLDKVYVRFENSCSPVSQEAVEVRDKDGKVLAHSKSIQVYKNDNRIHEISFEPIDFKAGETYTVVIPAGTFTVESVGHVNNEISVEYIGRETRPMTAIEISPRNESAINELGSTNMICLTFDGTTQTVTGKMGYLYQEGMDAPLTSLVLVASNNNVYVYPTAARKLMLDCKYRVVIPAGCIVDITGYCPNEEIVLDYYGAYEIPAPDPYSDYLFYEDFNNMSNSLSHMLRYEGDHNEPIGMMVNYEFDADNQPWNFSIRDTNDSADFAAASHSMYVNKGKSDDWMTTPQLVLSDGTEHYTLNFQTQSMLKDKTDYLKVLVWESEDVFNSLDKETVDKMRTEGKVIYNEKLTPGASEETLADDWTDVNIDLDSYKGKKIYIAFVNENENQSMVFVDNINVVRRNNYRTGFIMPETVMGESSVDATGFVEVTSNETFNNIKATLMDNDGNVVSVYEASGLNLTKDSGLYKFTFPQKLPMVEGEVNNYSMTVAMDSDEQNVTGKLSHLLFSTTKRVVLEEGTGAWCGNCPLGMIAIEHLEGTMGENFIPVAVHNGDTYAWREYDTFLALSGYPSGKVNRIDKILFPMYKDGDEDIDKEDYNPNYSFTSRNGDETFVEIVQREIEIPAVADIEIKKAEFDGDQTISVEAGVKFAMNARQANYNIFTVLVEDNLRGRQTNYFSGYDDPMLGEWAQGESYVTMEYKDVARSMAGGSFFGENGYIPTEIKAGEEYVANITLPVSSKVKSIGSCKVICMLIDAGSGEIKNAYRLNEISTGDTAVDEIGADVNVSITAVAGTIFVNGSAEGVEVYNIQGAKMSNNDLAKGLYIVRASVNGKVVTGKIMMR